MDLIGKKLTEHSARLISGLSFRSSNACVEHHMLTFESDFCLWAYCHECSWTYKTSQDKQHAYSPGKPLKHQKGRGSGQQHWGVAP